MAGIKISLRLQALLEAIPENCRVLADIGTDHGYLPLEAKLSGRCEKAIACDINPKPLETATKNISAFATDNNPTLLQSVETRLGNGLDPLAENEADCIVMAGMGGMKIIEIISAAPEKTKNASLILQPQHDMEELRRFLHSNSYIIIEEKIVQEGKRFYEIIVAFFTRQKFAPWTDAEYFIGKAKNIEFLKEKFEKLNSYANFISDKNEKILTETRLNWLKDYIHENNKADN